MASDKATQLNHYLLLGRSGLRVSPLCLGTMTFGTEWGWGSDESTSEQVFNAYAEKGGNFIDTADLYTNGTSERLVGKFLASRRDQFVLATKFSFNQRPGDPNAGGNHRKHLHEALEGSLKRLNTDYIDLYWVHAHDGITPVEETMRALDDAVRAGKILYTGVSDYPAWKVAEANTLAHFRGWSPFICLQIEYSLVERTVERDLLPMARDLGLGVTPWSPLAQGALSGKYLDASAAKEARLNQGNNPIVEKYLTDRARSAAAAVVNVAKRLGATPSQVALAWLLHQPGVTSVIIGARKVEHLHDNLASVALSLDSAALGELDAASKVDLGFPHEFLGGTVGAMLAGGTRIIPNK